MPASSMAVMETSPASPEWLITRTKPAQRGCEAGGTSGARCTTLSSTGPSSTAMLTVTVMVSSMAGTASGSPLASSPSVTRAVTVYRAPAGNTSPAFTRMSPAPSMVNESLSPPLASE